MKKSLAVLALFSFLAFGAVLSAQTVAEDELRSVGGRTIEFINYVGPHARIDTLDEIRDLGAALGRVVKTGAARAGGESRYSIIRVRDPSTAAGLDADIIILGPDAGVDHIRNLRHILGAYLEEAYGYSRSDGFLLATFLTVYNAVYRGNLEYFGKTYKPAVLTHLSAQNAGLSVRYDEWPGRSRIVLPITVRAGSAGRVDTGPITDKTVVESLKEESGTAALPERREMVDLKERELAEQKAALEEDKARVAREEQAASDEKTRAEAARAELEKDKAAAQGPEQEAELTRREAEVAAQEKAAAEKEAAVAAKEAEIAEDRKAVAEDQKAQIAQEVAAKAEAAPRGSVLLDLVDPNRPYARLALVDLAGGKYLKTGEMNTLRADSLLDVGGAFVAVAGRAEGSGAVRLVLLDLETLSAKVTGTVDVHPETGVWKEGAGVLAVASDGGKWVLGLFDPATLELKLKSETAVSPFTFLRVLPEGFVVAGAGGGLVLLNKADLKTIKEIRR